MANRLAPVSDTQDDPPHLETIDAPSTRNRITEISEADERDSRPIWYCRLAVSQPIPMFAVTLGCHLALMLLTIILLSNGYNLFPADFTGVPLSLDKDETKLRVDAWRYAIDGGAVTTGGQEAEREVLYQRLEFIYEGRSYDNILDREKLIEIAKFEKKIFRNSVYQNHACQIENRVCKRPLSILRFFDGTYRKLHRNFYDPYYRNIKRVLNTAHKLNVTKAILAYNLGKDAKLGPKIAKCVYARTSFFTGWPLKSYKGLKDDEQKQRDKLDNYINEEYATILEKSAKEGVGKMNFYYENLAMRRKATKDQVLIDFRQVVFAFLIIFMLTWFHVESLWVSLWTIFSLLSTFNITNLIYRVVFDYQYFGIFHTLSMFMILGIGPDSIFVFVNTWKLAGKKKFPSLEQRLSFAFRRAGKATMITSLISMIAFLCNVPSPLLGISTFGAFSAILVVVNYCSTFLFFPAVLTVHTKHRHGKCCCYCCFIDILVPTPVYVNQHLFNEEPDAAQYFRGPFYERVVGHKIVRWVMLVFFALLVFISIVFAFRLQPADQQMKVWTASMNWGKVEKVQKDKFVDSERDNVVTPHIIWGLRNQDRSQCHRSDYKCHGKTAFDTSFDMNLPPCQKAVLDFCTRIKTLPPNEADKLQLRRDPVTGEVETVCFMEDMQDYYQKLPTGVTNSFPFKPESMRSIMKEYPLLYNVSALSPEYYRYFEVSLGHFLTNGSKSGYEESYNYQKYRKYFGATQDFATSGRSCVKENKFGNKLLYMAIAVNTTIRMADVGYKTVLPIYRNWETFLSKEMKELPGSCKNAFQATLDKSNTWHWVKVQECLVKNAMTGIQISIILGLIVLATATPNIYVGFLATIMMGTTTIGVLAGINILRWKLDMLESISVTLVVSLGVDYLVHAAQGYVEEEEGTRVLRTQNALARAGSAVFSAGITTLGAAMSMLSSEIAIFVRFGVFIMLTVILSALTALVFFPIILSFIGPVRNQGSIMPLVKRVKYWIRGKANENEKCQMCKGKGFQQKPKQEVPPEHQQ